MEMKYNIMLIQESRNKHLNMVWPKLEYVWETDGKIICWQSRLRFYLGRSIEYFFLCSMVLSLLNSPWVFLLLLSLFIMKIYKHIEKV